MKKNIGAIDKVVRVVIAVVIALLYYMDLIVNNTLSAILLFCAAILLMTSLLNFCPLYFVFGINSCKSDSKKSNEWIVQAHPLNI